MGMWSRSNRYAMGSNAVTDQNQGGGAKKAGFPYMVGRGWRSSIAFGDNVVAGQCAKLKCYQTLRFPLAHQSRPTGTRGNVPYWNVIA